MRPLPLRPLATLASLTVVLALLLSGCLSSSARLNGTYAGGLYDDRVGFLGGFAIDVVTRGNDVEGAACFAALTDDIACDVLHGTLMGERFSFRVGAISFSATVRGERVSGRYTHAEGSGSFELSKDAGFAAAPATTSISAPKAALELLEQLRP